MAELLGADEAVYRAEQRRAMGEPLSARDVALMRGSGLVMVAISRRTTGAGSN